jgi:hypothetical protein
MPRLFDVGLGNRQVKFNIGIIIICHFFHSDFNFKIH